ncbi:MAG: DUF4388 domain-containing protein [Thermoanaerobaculia bacterium]
MSDSRFEFRGDLSKTPIPEVLQTVHHYRVPGVVVVRREAVEKKVYIWNGDVIFATSSDRDESLGNVLLGDGKLTREQFEESVRRLIEAREIEGARRHGAVLVDMGLLTAEELFAAVTRQVRGILFSLFEWDEGEVTFSVGRFRTDEIIQLEIPTRQAILAGVKAVRDARKTAALLGPSWTIFDPCWKPAELGDLALDTGELRLLQQVDGTKTLRELVGLGPSDAAQNAKLLYAFYVLKLISRRDMTSRTSVKKIHWSTTGGGYAPPS